MFGFFFLVLSAPLLAFAQNPFTLLPQFCPITFKACLLKKLDWTMDDYNTELLVLEGDYGEFPQMMLDVFQCQKRGKGSMEIEDEVPLMNGFTCPELVLMTEELLKEMLEGVNDDPKCEKACATTLAKCGEGLNLLSMSQEEYEKYQGCIAQDSVLEAGCCECKGNCPVVSESDAKSLCETEGTTAPKCKTALPGYAGICKYKRGKCTLHKLWPGNCADLKRRHCKLAVKGGGCDAIRKRAKHENKKLACEERSRR